MFFYRQSPRESVYIQTNPSRNEILGGGAGPLAKETHDLGPGVLVHIDACL